VLELLALREDARAELARAARERVRRRYDIRVVARQYAELYAEVRRSRPA
jgi:glycosyltransferase involved in cell wall biosynthesis